MAITPLTERQKTLIVNNVVKAVKNIDNLNKTGYNYLYLCSGFIAHYNLGGFIYAYKTPGSLKRDLVNNSRINQWKNFRPGDNDYDYYMSKADVYNRILAQIA
jgi:hypothetical protein